MQKIIQKFVFALATASFVFAVFFAFGAGAHAANTTDPLVANNPASNSEFQLVPCGTSKSLQGPTQSGGNIGDCDWSGLIQLANNIVNFLVVVSVSLATLAFCYAGFLYITAFGEMGKVEEAHSIFKTAITGIFFVLCGWLIVATILKVLVGNSGSGPANQIQQIVPFQNVKTIQTTQ